MATRPVVFSHGGVQATCQVNRNLSDAQIRAVAATGGVIGIGYWDAGWTWMRWWMPSST